MTARRWSNAAAWRRLADRAVNVTPLLLLNGFAAYGQAAWALDRITDTVAVAVAFAATVESVALVLASAAHRAAMAGDAAAGRRLASYAVAGVVGWLNWTHWSATNPTAGAVYAAFSALSPWLWGMWSRDLRRAELRATGLIDPRAARFSPLRWLLYPRVTFRVWRWAVWEGIGEPGAALARYAGDPAPVEAPVELAAPAPAPAAVAAPVAAPAPQRRSTPPPVGKGRRSDADLEAAALVYAARVRASDPRHEFSAPEIARALEVGASRSRSLRDLVNRGRAGVDDDETAGERAL